MRFRDREIFVQRIVALRNRRRKPEGRVVALWAIDF